VDLGLAGKKALVTGGSRGIGRAIARMLAEEGADLALCARGAEGLEDARAELEAGGRRVFTRAFDVADGPAFEQFIVEGAAALGGLDIFVHNTTGRGPAGEEGWRRNFEVDLMGAVRGVETALPFLEKSTAGSVIFIGTTAAIEAFGQPSPYAPMKAALLAYTNQLGQALAPRGIRVNTVSPGSIYFPGGTWERVEQNMPDYFAQVVESIPFGRLGTPEEVARVVAFVASPAASWVTGTNVIVDGGQHKRVD
jgi:NAD(P)-dependent dehydrogenase (short-subunit alcohol dehydrogenase family)